MSAPEVAHPLGATNVDDWSRDDAGATCRTFSQAPTHIEGVEIQTYGTQWAYGGCERRIVMCTPGSDGVVLTSRQARRVAEMLRHFADTAELYDFLAAAVQR